MKYISKNAAQKFENGKTCVGFEYGGSPELSGATAIINGRYPEAGWAMNEMSQEMVYVISGTGSLTTKQQTIGLRQGDVALLEINEPYYFEGVELQVFLPTTPAWTPEQHKIV